MRAKQIAALELLWAVLCVIMWSPLLRGAYVTLYEDNESARCGLLRGLSKQTDLNFMLALFWTQTAKEQTRFWFDCVASADNPADCLTRRGVDSTHLAGAVDDSSRLDWSGFFKTAE